MIYYQLIHHDNGKTSAILRDTEDTANYRLEALAQDVAMGLSVEVADLIGPCRSGVLADVRTILAHLAYQAGYNKSAIGRFLSRDHSTIISAIRRYGVYLATDDKFQKRVALVQRYRTTKDNHGEAN